MLCPCSRVAQAFVGVGAFVLSNIFASWIVKLQQPVVKRLQERRDARAALMGELTRGIGLIKCYGCEAAWASRITSARAAELRQLRNLRYLSAATGLVCGVLSQAAPVTIFAWCAPLRGP